MSVFWWVKSLFLWRRDTPKRPIGRSASFRRSSSSGSKATGNDQGLPKSVVKFVPMGGQDAVARPGLKVCRGFFGVRV